MSNRTVASTAVTDRGIFSAASVLAGLSHSADQAPAVFTSSEVPCRLGLVLNLARASLDLHSKPIHGAVSNVLRNAAQVLGKKLVDDIGKPN